jgi:hypothetical protein
LKIVGGTVVPSPDVRKSKFVSANATQIRAGGEGAEQMQYAIRRTLTFPDAQTIVSYTRLKSNHPVPRPLQGGHVDREIGCPGFLYPQD